MSNNNNKAVNLKTVLTAPHPKRLGAFLIDQLVMYAVFAIYFTLCGVSPDTAASALVYFGAVVLNFAYRVLYPIYVNRGDRTGQTIGKRAMGIKVISADGSNVTLKALSIRSLFMLVIEGFELFAISYLMSAISLIGIPQIAYIAYMNIVIGIASVALMFIKPSHQLLHDYVASTVVILVKQ